MPENRVYFNVDIFILIYKNTYPPNSPQHHPSLPHIRVSHAASAEQPNSPGVSTVQSQHIASEFCIVNKKNVIDIII